MLNGKNIYSMETIASKFAGAKNRQEAREFIFFLEKRDIITKTVFRYDNRNEYVYYPSAWFNEMFNGHFYAKEMKRLGKSSNDTLYFDDFASTVLGRYFRMFRENKGKKKDSELLHIVISRTALDKFVEKL